MKEKNEKTIISLKKDLSGKKLSKEIAGDYLIKNVIGEGTFSKVKLGINMLTGQKVAIKILDKLKLIEEEGIERVLREIKITSEIEHPNIIKIYDIMEDEKNYLVVMEYCAEGELFNYIVKKDRLSENESSFFYYQLINAIEYLHLNGIAHRDLKPENILLGENHIIKLIDFGLSNYISENKLLVTPCGSPCYASPEMIRGEEYNGADNDIWATGIILFAMLCGYLPFENDENSKNNNLLFKKILSGKLYYPEYLSDTAVDLMKKILVNSPKKRIKINEIKKHDFYLKGKKIFEKKLKSNTLNEINIYNQIPVNLQNDYNKKDNDIQSIKDKYINNIFSNEHHNNNKYKVLNIFRKKYFDNKKQMINTYKNKNDISLTTENNKNVKNTQYLATESNNNKLNSDALVPLNTKLINSLHKRNFIREVYNPKEIYDSYLHEKIKKMREEKENEVSKNIKDLLPFRENRYSSYNRNNIFTQFHQKKEKSMDYPYKNNKLFFNNNSINTEFNYKSPNKRPLIQVKIYSSNKKNKNLRMYENDALFTDININKPKIKMDDKLIINLTNKEEKNKSLLRIHKKLQNLENLYSSNKNFNLRLKTDIRTQENFPYINSNRNASIFSPKIEKNIESKKEKRFFIKNLHNYINLKNKNYLNYFMSTKNNHLSPNSIKI